jgi:hypothetical protein
MLPGVQFPLSSEKPYEFYALIETQGSHKEHDEAVSPLQYVDKVVTTLNDLRLHLEIGKLP